MKNKLPERTWFPEPHQLVINDNNNPPYLHSVWVGLTTPFIHLPIMIWRGILSPMVDGVSFIIQFTLVSVVTGLRGKAGGYLVDMPVIRLTVTEEPANEPKE